GIRDDLVTGVQTCALPISVTPVAAEVYQSDRICPASRSINEPAKSMPAPTSTIGRTPKRSMVLPLTIEPTGQPTLMAPTTRPASDRKSGVEGKRGGAGGGW